MDITRRKSVSLQLNITPLIDIVFLLLIFFMLTSTFMKEQAIELSLPQSESAAVASEEIVRLGVIDEFTYVLNGVSYSKEEVRSELQALLLAAPKAPPVLLQIDEQADVQLLVDSMDMLKEIGLAEISLAATDK